MAFIDEIQNGSSKNGVPEISMIRHFLTASTEFEFFGCNNNYATLSREILNRYGSHSDNEGSNVISLDRHSGFSNSFHTDGSVRKVGYPGYSFGEGTNTWHSIEAATSPMYISGFDRLRSELSERIDRLTLGNRANYRKNMTCSNHIHFTLRYNRHEGVCFSNFPARKIYGRFVKIIRKFYPVIRVLGMTSKGSNVRQNSYGLWAKNIRITSDGRDRLFYSYNFYDNASYENFDVDRASIVRSFYMGSDKFHVELRHCDGNLSHTLLALNMSLIGSIFLWACDLVREDQNILIGRNHIERNVQLMNEAVRGNYDSAAFKAVLLDLLANIYPYMRMLTGSTECEGLLIKIVEKPCSVFFTEKGDIDEEFDSGLDFLAYEKYLNGRNRTKDDELRQEFIKLTRIGYFNRAENLTEYQYHVAEVLTQKLRRTITQKNVNSLYLMLRREGINLEFNYGKLVLV